VVNQRLKELTSKQAFSLREPYGRNNVDLQRLAVLCGTTNDKQILNDPTGNRRIIPLHVHSIDNAKYNAIDKTDLIMEAYHLYKAGFRWQLNREDISTLAQFTGQFESYPSEYELILKYFEPGDLYLTATEIKIELERHSQQKLSLDMIGKQLARLGFKQKSIKENFKPRKVWCVERTTNPLAAHYAKPDQPVNNNPDGWKPGDPLPF
jgi:predicted P-loop ATPase